MSHNPNETTEHIVSNMINWSDKVIKSQHELNTCNDGKRSSDVVLSAVEKCERLQKQLEIAVEAIKAVLHDEFILEHADAGLVMYLTQAEYKIKELNK